MNSKKTLAMLMAAILTASMGMSAFAADATGDKDKDAMSGDITASVTVKNPIIAVTVPTTMDVLLDAFQAGDASGSQIFSAYVPVANKSNVPVNVKFKAKVVPKSGESVQVVATAEEAKPASTADSAKKIYVAMAPIATVTLVDDETSVKLDDAESAAGSYAKNPQAAITTKANNEMTYSLAAAEYDLTDPVNPSFTKIKSDATTKKVTGAGAFRFMGTLNQNATWANDTIEIKPTYEIKGMLADDYKAAKPLTGTANVTVLTNGTFGPTIESTSTEIAAFDPTADFELKIDVGTGTDGATKVMSIKAGTTTLTSGTDYEFALTDPDSTTDKSGKITFKSAAGSKINGKTVTITFDKGNPKTLDVTFPQK